MTADIAAKSLRRAQKAVREAGADNIPLVLQGGLLLATPSPKLVYRAVEGGKTDGAMSRLKRGSMVSHPINNDRVKINLSHARTAFSLLACGKLILGPIEFDLPKRKGNRHGPKNAAA